MLLALLLLRPVLGGLTIFDNWLNQDGTGLDAALVDSFQRPSDPVSEEYFWQHDKIYNVTVNNQLTPALAKENNLILPVTFEEISAFCDMTGLLPNRLRGNIFKSHKKNIWGQRRKVRIRKLRPMGSVGDLYMSRDWKPQEFAVERDDCLRRAAGLLRAAYARSDQKLLVSLKNLFASGTSISPTNTAIRAKELSKIFQTLGNDALNADDPNGTLSRVTSKMTRALKMLKDAFSFAANQRRVLRELRDSGKTGYSDAMQDSRTTLNAAMRDFQTKLNAFDRSVFGLVVSSSRNNDRDGLGSVRKEVTDMTNLNKRLLSSVRTAGTARDQFLQTVEAKVNELETKFVDKLVAGEQTQNKQALEAGKRVMGKTGSIGDRYRRPFDNAVKRAERHYGKTIMKTSAALNKKIQKNEDWRRRVFGALDGKLHANLSQVVQTSQEAVQKARVDFINPAILSMNTTDRELRLLDLEFARDRELAMVDARKLLNQTVAAMETVLHAFEDDWASARLASTGDFGSLSNEFLNRLASVGAAMKEQLADIVADVDAVQADGTEEIAHVREANQASLDDVDRYMSGTAVHLDENAVNLKEILITKKAELGATTDFLKQFLLGRVANSNKTFAEAISELGGVIEDVDQLVTSGSAEAGKTQIASAKDLMEQQLSALMASGAVKAEALQQLVTAAQVGDAATFNKLYNEQLSADAALADAVKQNLELASLSSTLASEADGDRKGWLQGRLRQVVAGNKDAVDLLRAQIAAQLTAARGSLNTLSVQRMAEFKTLADEAISMAATVSMRVASPNATQAVTNVISPLLARIDALKSKIVPSLLASLANFKTATERRGVQAVETLQKAEEATADAGVDDFANSTDSARAAMAGRFSDKLELWYGEFAVFRNDTELFSANLPTASAGLVQAMAEMHSTAAETLRQLQALQTQPQFQQLANFVSQSQTEEETRKQQTLQQTDLGMASAIGNLKTQASRSTGDITAETAVVKTALSQSVASANAESMAVQQNFTRAMQTMDVQDANFTRSLASAEISALLGAWGSLQQMAPAVNASLKTATPTNMRSRIGSSVEAMQKLQSTNAAAFSKALSAMTTGAAGNMNEVFDAMLKSVQTASDGSLTLANNLLDTYTKYDLSPVADTLRALGPGISDVGTLSGNLTSGALASSAQTAQAATAEASTTTSISKISAEAVMRLLTAFAAKKQLADAALSTAATGALRRQANVEEVLQIWKSLFDSATGATEQGYEDLTAAAAALRAALDEHKTKNEVFVASELSKIESQVNSNRSLLTSLKTPRQASISTILQRLATTKNAFKQLQSSLGARNATADAQVAAFKDQQKTFDDSMRDAVFNWEHHLTGALQTVLAQIQA